jgi:hypothetical protein
VAGDEGALPSEDAGSVVTDEADGADRAGWDPLVQPARPTTLARATVVRQRGTVRMVIHLIRGIPGHDEWASRNLNPYVLADKGT